MAVRRAAALRKARGGLAGIGGAAPFRSLRSRAGYGGWAAVGGGCSGWARGLRRLGADPVAPRPYLARRGLASAAAPVTRSITMIKKLTPDGEQCRKCNDIEARLERDGLLDQIDTHIYMDLDDPNDPGTVYATKYDVKVAPFFVVQNLDEKREVIDEEIFTVYLKMKKKVFDVAASKDEEAADVALSIF